MRQCVPSVEDTVGKRKRERKRENFYDYFLPILKSIDRQ